MELTPRLRQLLVIMLQNGQKMSVQALAEELGISKRTVQRELEYIDSSLKSTGISFVSKAGSGIWLDGSKEEKEKLLLKLKSEDHFDSGNRSERRKRLILEILKEKGLKKLFYYSSKFKVSEATISGDLEEAQEWLEQYGLHILRKPGSGIEIDGSEEHYRRAIRAFIEENLDTGFFMEAYGSEDIPKDPVERLQNSGVGQILRDDILKRVVQCILTADAQKIKKLTESSYMGLILHLSIAVYRILNREILETDTAWHRELQNDSEYDDAVKIARALEKEFDIQVPEIEISYICLHLKAAKHEKIQWGTREFTEIEKRGFPQLVSEIIDAFDRENAYWLKQDEEFLQGLLAHLQPTIIRILYQMPITNPILDSVKEEYPEVYQKSVSAARVLEKWLGKEIPEAEIGFLAIHFGAAIVRLEGERETFRQVQVGVVCSSGIGISRLMYTKLEKQFRGRAKLSVYGKKDLTPYVIGKTDFFVSSIPLELLEAPIVFVNPLLNESDMEEIQRLIGKFERIPKKNAEEDSVSLQLETINLMAAQINTVVKYMEFIQVKREIDFAGLLEIIGKRLSPYQDWGEIICEDLKRREQIASQIFAEFGFALLHARSNGVVRPGFAVCMTEDLQPFSDPYMKGIRVAFVMLIPFDENMDVNSEILGYISSLLIEDSTFMEVVLAGNAKEIQHSLSLQLKKFFREYLADK